MGQIGDALGANVHEAIVASHSGGIVKVWIKLIRLLSALFSCIFLLSKARIIDEANRKFIEQIPSRQLLRAERREENGELILSIRDCDLDDISEWDLRARKK